MTPVAFDACVLTWALQGLYPTVPLDAPEPTDKAALARVKTLREKAVALVTMHEASKSPIALPSIVVAEFFCIVPDAHQDAMMRALGQGFAIYPFDHQAARVSAELQRERMADGTYAAIKVAMTGEDGLRAKLKVDTMIVATAIRWGIGMLYSHDRDFKSIAKGKIAVSELPPRPPEQKVLPEVAAVKKT